MFEVPDLRKSFSSVDQKPGADSCACQVASSAELNRDGLTPLFNRHLLSSHYGLGLVTREKRNRVLAPEKLTLQPGREKHVIDNSSTA